MQRRRGHEHSNGSLAVLIFLVMLAACGGNPAPAPACLRTNVPSPDTTVYALDSVDVKPMPQGLMEPLSPDMLISRTHTPNVEAEAIVETTGSVSERSIVLRHIDNSELAASVIEYVKNSQYCPAIRRGLPVRAKTLIRVYIVKRRIG